MKSHAEKLQRLENFDELRRLVREALAAFPADDPWRKELEFWLAEFSRIRSDVDLEFHATRIRDSLFGMGRLADAADETQLLLAKKLSLETARLLRKINN